MKHFKRPALAGMLTCVLALAAGGAWAQDKVTLRVWDSFTENTEGMDAMIAAFEAANPTIDVERDVQSTEDMRAVIQTALNSGTGPDVFQYDTGPGFAGVLAKAGLIKPLDDLYAGPLSKVLPWTKERVTFDGKAYGVGNQLEFIAVYYNKDLFAANNIAVPTTYAEFQAACTTLKDAGITPIAFGNAAGWPAFHVFSAYANNMVPQDKLMAMIPPHVRNILNGIPSVGAVVTVCVIALAGCETKEEKILDIETPRMKFEVNKTSDGSKVEIKKETKPEIVEPQSDTP